MKPQNAAGPVFALSWLAFILLPVLLVYGLQAAGIVRAYHYQVLINMGVNVILAVSLNLVNGFNGQFSIGHAGFMGVGAYSAAVLTSKAMTMPFLPATMIGGLATGLLAYLVGIPAFRTRSDYLAVITLAFNMIVVNLLQNFDYVGGSRGLPGIMPYTNFAWVWGWVVMTVVVIRNLILSAHGKAVIAIRENEVAAELGGINLRYYKLLAFSIAAFFAGVAGSMSAHLLQFAAPQNFNIFRSFDILVMIYLGGIGSITGAMGGAILWTLLLELLRPLGVWRLVVGPVLLVILMIGRPKGLMGTVEAGFIIQRAKRKEEKSHAAPA
ncbi:hypothetical protein SY88_09130 [Clostridiales bacterium PH28_bin88]|nr:hypothetical protein SY88_09130 [Clostridiales bacterium PH28_bin88]